MLDYLPSLNLIDTPFNVKSLKYEDLIGVCKDKFPDLEIESKDYAEGKKTGPKKLKKVPLGAEPDGDGDYGISSKDLELGMQKLISNWNQE